MGTTSSITLSQLRLRNFKGIRELELDLHDDDLSVYGDNGTGKTSLLDAVTWLLYDRDSRGTKKFEVKRTDSTGEVAHGLDHEVEAVWRVDGKELTLRRVYREVYTKHRGSQEAVFTGHTSDYWVNGVPVQLKEFSDQVERVFGDQDAVRLLTDPRYFAEELHWQKRRDLLLQICGDVTPEEVAAAHPELADLVDHLPDDLADPLDGLRRQVKARLKEINSEVDQIPVRIDEVNQDWPDLPEGAGADGWLEAKQAERTELAQQLEDLREQRATAVAGGAVAELRSDLADAKTQLQEAKAAAAAGVDAELEQVLERLKEARGRRAEAQLAWHIADSAVTAVEDDIKAAETAREQLRTQWHARRDEEFAWDPEKTTCPTCGRAYEDAEEQRAKAAEDFNAAKAEDLRHLTARGQELANRVEGELQGELQQREAARADAQAELDAAEEPVNGLVERAADLREERDRPTDEVKAAKAAVEEASEALAAAKQDVTEQAKLLDGQITELRTELDSLDQQLRDYEAVRKAEARVAELTAQERELAEQYEAQQHLLDLTDEFLRAKVAMLEDQVNEHFDLARFRMFNQLQHGGLEEVCEVTYRGVPFSTNLSGGERTRLGLDIISTLQRHLGRALPVWVDNAESTTRLPSMPGCQVIRLVVSEPDKELRFEYGDDGSGNIEEAA